MNYWQMLEQERTEISGKEDDSGAKNPATPLI
jgi:hypothetical protein